MVGFQGSRRLLEGSPGAPGAPGRLRNSRRAPDILIESFLIEIARVTRISSNCLCLPEGCLGSMLGSRDWMLPRVLLDVGCEASLLAECHCSERVFMKQTNVLVKNYYLLMLNINI